MNASQIAFESKLLKGTVHFRLRKLGYETGLYTDYNDDVLEQVKEFDKYIKHKPKVNHEMEAEIYFYWKSHKHNSYRNISEALNIPINRVTLILSNVIKKGFIIVESKLNNIT